MPTKAKRTTNPARRKVNPTKRRTTSPIRRKRRTTTTARKSTTRRRRRSVAPARRRRTVRRRNPGLPIKDLMISTVGAVGAGVGGAFLEGMWIDSKEEAASNPEATPEERAEAVEALQDSPMPALLTGAPGLVGLAAVFFGARSKSPGTRSALLAAGQGLMNGSAAVVAADAVRRGRAKAKAETAAAAAPGAPNQQVQGVPEWIRREFQLEGPGAYVLPPPAMESEGQVSALLKVARR